MRYRRYITVGAAALAISISHAGCAQEVAEGNYNIAEQELKYSLRDLARQAGFELVAPSDALAGRRAPALRGHYTLRQAVAVLLEGSGLTADFRDRTIFIRGRSQAPVTADEGSSDIIVTGSRIRGAQLASPLIRDSREDIDRKGYTDLGSYARSIPQNYSGGQNPGVISSVQSGSENFNSSSTLNLRGLGPDATLTLLNGHRVAYDAANQGIDISAIPLLAVDRVETVADGASALYGSDAVGGVANIILRPDYDGVVASARIGGATSGGANQQQYGVLIGQKWAAGGFAVTGEFNRSTSIEARQRSYTRGLEPGLTLLPSQRSWSGVIAAHQSVWDGVEVSLDGHVNERRSRSALPFATNAPADQSGIISTPKVFSFSLSPAIAIDLPADWRLTLRGTRGESNSASDVAIAFGGSLFATNRVHYDNGLWAGEVNFEGPVVALPAGEIRLALGGGFRSLSLDASIRQQTAFSSNSLLDYHDQRTVTFGYGELSIPVIGEPNSSSFAQRLDLSVAVRYEHYSAIGGLATPKFGVIYKPVADLALKMSWGRSFKAPTLSQINLAPSGALVPASDFFPAAPDARPILLLGGGNRNLEPERATTWTISAEFKPAAVPGLRIGVSHFAIRYRNRVVTPIPDYTQAFTGSIYRDLILLNPTAAQVAAQTANLPLGVVNQTGSAFDPAFVGAIIQDQFQNAASQRINGFDLTAGYDLQIGADRLEILANASYLRSRQKLSAAQPSLQQAGLIFNPPHWRFQSSATWIHGIAEFTGSVNYIGGTQDKRDVPTVEVDDFVSLDASLRLRPSGSGLFAAIEVLASASNILDRKPSIIRTSGGNSPTYDATNYSAIGRLLSLTLIKRF